MEKETVIHDTSRIDRFMEARRRAIFLHALWRPMLAGAVGAALIVGAVWAASPKLHFNVVEVPKIVQRDMEIIVPRITYKDVIVPKIITRDVYVDHVIVAPTSSKACTPGCSAASGAGAAGGAPVGASSGGASGSADTAGGPSGGGASSGGAGGPTGVAGGGASGAGSPVHGAAGGADGADDGGTGGGSPNPVADLPAGPIANPAYGPQSPYAAKTPEERKFVDQPEYKDAKLRGRIIKSVDGRALSFEDGQSFWPAHWDSAAQKPVGDKDQMVESEPYVGDLGMCVEDKTTHLYGCTALHHGGDVQIINVPMPGASPTGTWQNPTGMNDPRGTTPVDKMVNTNVDVSGYPIIAMVDTGCSWPMSIPKVLADTLVSKGKAIRTSPAKSTLADGSVQDTNVVVINRITVDGRVLKDVVAAVGESNWSPILLGLGALNRLGQYSIADGKLVFTGSQPS
jgi:gag-polyprotein putative aspartyl protease